MCVWTRMQCTVHTAASQRMWLEWEKDARGKKWRRRRKRRKMKRMEKCLCFSRLMHDGGGDTYGRFFFFYYLFSTCSKVCVSTGLMCLCKCMLYIHIFECHSLSLKSQHTHTHTYTDGLDWAVATNRVYTAEHAEIAFKYVTHSTP